MGKKTTAFTDPSSLVETLQPHFLKSMEQNQHMAALKTRKRRRQEEDHPAATISLDELNQDLLEKILSWLPASSFFRLGSVCKRWRSAAASATFHISCSEVPFREPWFLMVDPDLGQSIVFDTSEGNWKKLKRPALLQENHNLKSIPVASSGGLVCFRSASGGFVICNPVTGACRELPPSGPANGNEKVHAISMNSSPGVPSSYKLILVSGDFPNLAVKVYDSAKEQWEEAPLFRKPSKTLGLDISAEETVYFLSKAGDVVTTNMQRSPFKQYSSVMAVEDGEESIYFLSSTGAVVACNLTQKSFFEYPRLLPIYSEYSIDVVQCVGEMMVVVLSEFLESASLRVWRFCKQDQSWHQVAAMPPSMSHEFYGKKADINCVGFGDMVFICLNSCEFSRYIVCNLVSGDWCELPDCFVNGSAVEFMSAFSFEPRVEALV